ncbi:hypothetical protein Z043_109489 [Scleropages formosus]|uniref:ABC transporter domain-containing protein n=1 Tax=Scleropages formosus TaxID=113540 RepID=A0A0P7UQW4_SCLFO|nr:hypothetical protein Z043_109489 [Scleropages formosus]
MYFLQNSLNNAFIQNFIRLQTNIDVIQMKETLNTFSNITSMLIENQDIVQQITTLSSLMMNLSSCVNFDRFQAFNSTDELSAQAEALAKTRDLYASVIFKLPQDNSSSSWQKLDVSGNLPPRVEYTIRMNIENVMRTDRTRNLFWVQGPYISSIKTQRYNRGFVYLQESIDRAIIEMQTGSPVEEPAVQLQAFPYPCYLKDEYLNSVSYAFPLVLMIAWVLFVAQFVKKLVLERELRLHEYMKMMGVNPVSHFFAWFLESAAFLLLTIIILTIILKAGQVLPNSDGFLLFLYLCDYGLAILAISFLISSFFDKTNIAGLSGSLIYVICFFPFIVVMSLETTLSVSAKSALSLFAPTCFSYASQYIARYEIQGEGIQWSNSYISPILDDSSSFGWLCWLLLIDSVIYFLLGMYIRSVFPAEGSVSFQEENEFQGLRVGVSLHGLTKLYGSEAAIKNLNISFYEGHVTALLGHNGAGKTTTIILQDTGLYTHRHKRVGTLSGGMKRKLSISIAFIGGSHLVVLDEPTTGVDPCSRRAIWDIIIQHKKDLYYFDFAFHFICTNEPYFQAGYIHLPPTTHKHTQFSYFFLSIQVQTPESNVQFDSEEVKTFIQSYIPEAQLKEGGVSDIVYKLPPFSSQNAMAYHSLLTNLDKNLDSLQLGCYGISDTTLEEVFLQLTKDERECDTGTSISITHSAMDVSAARDGVLDELSDTNSETELKVYPVLPALTGSPPVRGLALFGQRVAAMFLKRAHHSRRDWKGLFAQVLLPTLFVIAAMGLGSIQSNLLDFPEMELSPALYRSAESYSFFSSQNANSTNLVDTMLSFPGIDNVCLNNPDDTYGGWEFGASLPADLKMGITAVPPNRTLTKVWYNPEGYHSMPAYLNSLNNFILRSNLPAEKDPRQYGKPRHLLIL